MATKHRRPGGISPGKARRIRKKNEAPSPYHALGEHLEFVQHKVKRVQNWLDLMKHEGESLDFEEVDAPNVSCAFEAVAHLRKACQGLADRADKLVQDRALWSIEQND